MCYVKLQGDLRGDLSELELISLQVEAAPASLMLPSSYAISKPAI